MTDRPASIVFDRIAEEYDETRGGEERGQAVASAFARLLPHTGPVLEVGVGTGLVAQGLVRLGFEIVGVDLSMPMVQRARHRLGGRVVLGDALRLPLAPGSVLGAYAVWVLHLVADMRAALAEIARVLRPGGLLLVVPGVPTRESTDIQAIVGPMLDHIRPRGDDIDRISRLGDEVGLHLVECGEFTAPPSELSPLRMASQIERRIYSALWDIDEETWSRHVEPAIARLHALPDPDMPRRVHSTYPLLVLDRG